MNRLSLVIGLGALLLGCQSHMQAPPAATAPPPPPMAQETTPAFVTAAIADASRPADDTARDAARRPADMLIFAGIQPGQRVADLIPGGGYFTRLFAKAVGPGGKVFAITPPARPNDPKAGAIAAIAADPAYSNVTQVPFAGPFAVPEPVDVIFTAQNYHDLHLAMLHLDVPAMNRAFFAALKPGGVLVIVDHSAKAGTGLDVPDKLHRIDEEIVKQEVTAAGFVLEGESNVLRNPADTREIGVFDPAVRGKTDQFVLRFRKPG